LKHTHLAPLRSPFRTWSNSGALIRAAERWKSIRVTEFERRQLSVVKKELDQQYGVQVDLKRKPSKGAAQTKISSSSQT